MSKYDSKNGRYVYESHERVDNSSIRSICNKIKEQADKIDSVANDKWNTAANLENVARDIAKSSKTLKVNGRMYDTYFKTLQESMTADYKNLKDIADRIIKAADSRRSTENDQYSTYWWRIKEEEEAAKNNN